jgi:hypothetical protein
VPGSSESLVEPPDRPRLNLPPFFGAEAEAVERGARAIIAAPPALAARKSLRFISKCLVPLVKGGISSRWSCLGSDHDMPMFKVHLADAR